MARIPGKDSAVITSYMPIHDDEQYEGQHDFERARALQVRRTAESHGIPVRLKPDGDTSYLETRITLERLENGMSPADLDRTDDELWRKYVQFLMDLEDSNLGYLIHEVDTTTEYELVEDLLYIGDDSCSLRYVDVDYRDGS